MKTWEQGKDFLSELKSDKDVTAKIPPADLDAMFDLDYHTTHVDTIFRRVFGNA
jgi:adenylosuccinate lyase